VFHHPDLAVVVKRDVDVRVRDEVQDSRRQLGQRTASPTVPSVAVSSVNEDGNTGRGCSSG
jgi:hypothetical protein